MNGVGYRIFQARAEQQRWNPSADCYLQLQANVHDWTTVRYRVRRYRVCASCGLGERAATPPDTLT